MPRYAYESFGYATPPELTGGPAPAHYPVVIVGAGPVGLAMAVDLALHDVPSVVIDDNDTVSLGSRAICWAKRTLEIFDRLGVGARMVEKGVTWKVGRLFHGAREIYSFDLLPETGHKMPAFVNLQQYYVEQYLVERCRDFPGLIDLRFKNRVTGVEKRAKGAQVQIETPDGIYEIAADWLIACDGARSPVRAMLGLDFEGRPFEERFLIADVEMAADFPSERLFWFEPPFHSGQSALLHKQPDDIYRIDLQLGPDADPDEERKPEKVIPRIRAMVGDRPFRIDWVSVYTFQCRRLARFVHDHIVFAGDSAHVVSPFGARGGNGGIHDVDNLAWKLAAVLKGDAPVRLIESYDEERVRGADENILHSANATNFMTPKSAIEKIFRDEALRLAACAPFARKLVNSGRLSLPCSLAGLELQTEAVDDPPLTPGTVAPDAPVTKDGQAAWLLNQIGGDFAVLTTAPHMPPVLDGLRVLRILRPDGDAADGALIDSDGHVFRRYGAGMTYLIRPDQHIAAAFGAPDAGELMAARERATAR